MATDLIASLVLRLLKIPDRLQSVVAAYILALMLDGPKRTLAHAAAVSGLHKAQFSRLLTNHGALALASLQLLAIEACRRASIDRGPIVKGAPWSIVIIVDATLHPRASLHVQNAQRFNHGQGFVCGHQWTNIVIFINGQLIPLPPIAFLSKKECKRRHIPYKSEHAKLAAYLDELQLEALVGFHRPEEVVVIVDSDYDNKRLQRTILDRGWDFIASLKCSRGAQTSHETKTKPKTWRRVNALFRAVKRTAPWTTVRVETDGGKRRKQFRARKLTGRINGVFRDVTLVCSEKSTGKGRRYFACSNTKVTVGVILRAYRIRWRVELFHRAVKGQLGMLDVGVSDFDAMIAHVHWVYSAWLLLHEVNLRDEPSLLGRQRSLQAMVSREPLVAEIKQIVAARTQFGGLPRQRRLVQAVTQTQASS